VSVYEKPDGEGGTAFVGLRRCEDSFAGIGRCEEIIAEIASS
jgi:hypothetical protein